MLDNGDTVGRLLRRHAAARGAHPLLITDTEELSYAEADRRSAHLAARLVGLGAAKGTHIGLLYPNGAAFVVGFLAAARLGAPVIPLSTFATAPELQDQLTDSDAEILLAADSFREHDYAERLSGVSAPALRHIVVGGVLEADPADRVLLAALEADVDGCDPLAVVYTSGSTGTPKGAVHTHQALLGHQRNLNAIRALSADDRLFCVSPFFWIGGLAFGLLATLVAGSTLVCSTAADAGVTLDLLERAKPTTTNGFAAGVAHLTRHPSFPARDLSAIRRGNLYPIMAADTRPADPELRHNMLGMTEAGGVVLICGDDGDQPEHRRGSFGKPAPGFETRIVHPDTAAPVEVGDTGELCIRGPYLMQHYHKRSREECFDPDGWFHTGDLVRVSDEGFYYYLGRRDAMIKTAGATVSPAEVEKAIATVTGGMVAHVFGVDDPQRGQLVAAVVIVDRVDDFDEASLRRKLAAVVSSYKVPRRFAALTAAQVPLRSSGKVDTTRLATVFDA